MSRLSWRVPPGWSEEAALLVFEDYSCRVECDRDPLIGVEDGVNVEGVEEIFRFHDDPEAAARAAIECLSERGLVVESDGYVGWRGSTADETTANRLRAWAAVGAPVVSPDAARATAEGLRRIGVAVAVWAGMAAAFRRGVVEADRAQRMHRIALDLAAALNAERAARRKWELRLRWRFANEPGTGKRPWKLDRLLSRYVYDSKLNYLNLPIAGPRGVLP